MGTVVPTLNCTPINLVAGKPAPHKGVSYPDHTEERMENRPPYGSSPQSHMLVGLAH